MRDRMRVAVIGAARRNNGIGGYIARYLHASGVEVASVLGTTWAGAREAATGLSGHGIHALPFTGFQEMMKAALPDAVVIASPTHTHREYVERCLDEGVHILCEKPFVSPEPGDAQSFVEQAIERAGAAGLTVAMNSQWPFSLPAYEELCGKIDAASLKSFYMRLSPQVPGIDMIPDSIPHALSMLYSAAGPGVIKDITLEKAFDALDVSFVYHASVTSLAARVELRRETVQPRTFAYGFNGLIVRRLIEPETYTISLTYGAKNLKIPDPLELSVRDFTDAVRTGRGPFVGMAHIVDTMRCLIEIYRSY